MHRQLAVLAAMLMASAVALPQGGPVEVIKNNVNINLKEGGALTQAPAPSAAPDVSVHTSVSPNGGINVDANLNGVDFDNSVNIDGGNVYVDADGVKITVPLDGYPHPNPTSSANHPPPPPPKSSANRPPPPPPRSSATRPASSSRHAQPTSSRPGPPRPSHSSQSLSPHSTSSSSSHSHHSHSHSSSTSSTSPSFPSSAYSSAPPPPPPSTIPSSTTTTPTSSTSSAPPPASSSANPYFISGVGVLGISWDQFTGTDQACKTEAQITSDITQLISYGYSSIRVYGIECNAVDIAISACEGTGAKMIAGIFTPTAVESETASFISQVNGRWDYIEFVTVFNEAVNDGTATVAQVEAAVAYVKARVPNNVQVVAVDTFAAFISNPDLCNVGSSFIAANCEPYFSAIEASTAGTYVLEQRANVAAACSVSVSDVLITESGWPYAGDTLGAAVPSKQNQYNAVTSLISAFDGEIIVFEAFSDQWKAPGPDDVENYFGLYNPLYPQ